MRLVVAEAAHHQKLFLLQGSGIDEQLFIVFKQRLISAVYDHGIGFSECNQFFVIVKDGIRVGCLGFGVDFPVVGIDGDPGRTRGKACLRGVVPLYRRPGVVAAFEGDAGPENLVGQRPVCTPFPVCVDALDISEIIRAFEWIIGHAELFSLIDIGCALQHVQACGKHFGGYFPIRRAVVAKPGDGAGLVVIVPEQAVPCLTIKVNLPAGQDFFQGDEGHFLVRPLAVFAVALHMFKLEHHI